MNSAHITAAEREHLERVKLLACSVCDLPGPSEAHHVKQGSHWLCVSLCPDCHRGGFNGLHGQRRIWSVKKIDELDALAITVERLMRLAP